MHFSESLPVVDKSHIAYWKLWHQLVLKLSIPDAENHSYFRKHNYCVYTAFSIGVFFNCCHLKIVNNVDYHLTSTCTSATIHDGFAAVDHLVSKAVKSHNMEDDKQKQSYNTVETKPEFSHNEKRHVNTVIFMLKTNQCKTWCNRVSKIFVYSRGPTIDKHIFSGIRQQAFKQLHFTAIETREAWLKIYVCNDIKVNQRCYAVSKQCTIQKRYFLNASFKPILNQ